MPAPRRAEAPDTGLLAALMTGGLALDSGLLAALKECIGEQGLEVEAVIAGAGFNVRREDMKKLLTATRAMVFTLHNMDRLNECTRAGNFKTRPAT